MNIRIVFVDLSHPEALVLVEELNEYARDQGSIERVIGYACQQSSNMNQLLTLAADVEEAGAEFLLIPA